MDLDTLLNKNQKEAATYLDSHLRIIAGAGSGKTRVVTYRIAHLIQDVGIDPRSILAITFTNKAANELRSRLLQAIGEECASMLHASTFHSACVRILRRSISKLGYDSNFTIYDTDDSQRLMKSCIADADVSEKQFPPRAVLRR